MKFLASLAGAVAVIIIATVFLYLALDSLLLTPSPFGH